MAINTTIKTNPNAPASQLPARAPMKINQPSVSTARAEALKARLTGKTPATTQTIAPRAAGSSARQQQYSNQPKYPIPPLANAPVAPPPTRQQAFSDIEPPPSGNPAQRAAQAAGEMTATPQSTPAQPTIVTEAPAASTAEATSETASPQFAALARREQQIRRAQLELKAAQDAFAAKQAEYIPKSQLTSDTLKVLTENGIPYDRLVELQLAQDNPAIDQQLVARIAQLETRLAEVDKTVKTTFDERDSLQEQQVKVQMRRDAELLAQSDPTYETIRTTESYDDVVDLIEKVFKAEGVLLSVEEASTAVEEKLVDRKFQEVQKLMSIQKIKSRLAPPVTAPEETPASAETEAMQPQRTARQTTTLTAQGSSPKPMTARERAIARIKGEL